MRTRTFHHPRPRIGMTPAVSVLLLLATRGALAQVALDSSRFIRPWVAGSVAAGTNGGQASNHSSLGLEASGGVVSRSGWGAAARILQSETLFDREGSPAWRVRTITASITYQPPSVPLLHLRGGLGTTDAMNGIVGDRASVSSLETGVEIDSRPKSRVGFRLYALAFWPLSSPRHTSGNNSFVPNGSSVAGSLRQLYVGTGIFVR